MRELSLAGYVRKGLKRRAHFWKHCDATAGCADLSLYFPGSGTAWVELKSSDRWAVRAATKPGLTEEQALFLRQREGFLLWRVGREYLLLNAGVAWRIWERAGATAEEARRWALRRWVGRIRWAEFEDELTGGDL